MTEILKAKETIIKFLAKEPKIIKFSLTIGQSL